MRVLWLAEVFNPGEVPSAWSWRVYMQGMRYVDTGIDSRFESGGRRMNNEQRAWGALIMSAIYTAGEPTLVNSITGLVFALMAVFFLWLDSKK